MRLYVAYVDVIPPSRIILCPPVKRSIANKICDEAANNPEKGTLDFWLEEYGGVPVAFGVVLMNQAEYEVLQGRDKDDEIVLTHRTI